jgi:MFS family permease
VPIDPPRGFLSILLSVQFMANRENVIIVVAAPSIAATLHASGAELELTVSVYVFVSAMLLITSARLGKMFGCRPLYLIGLTTFTFASLLSGVAQSPLWLILSRVAQGVGSALMVAQVLTSIQLHFRGAARPRAIAAYTVSLSLSGVVAQGLGGLLVTANLFGTAWRPIFLINVPIGAILMIAALRIFPAPQRDEMQRAKLDVPGVAIFSAAMLLIILPLTLGVERGWPTWASASLMLGILAITAFIVFERRLSQRDGAPLVNTRIFGVKTVMLGLLALAFSRTAVFSFFFVVAVYLQVGLGHSALYSGSVVLWWGIAYGVAGPVYPRIPRRFAHLSGPVGCLLLITAFAGMGATALEGAADGGILVALFLLGGFGFGLLSTGLMSSITAKTPRDYASDLSGILSTMVPLATVVGISTFGSTYLFLVEHIHEAASRAFGATAFAFALSASVALLAASATARETRTLELAPAS